MAPFTSRPYCPEHIPPSLRPRLTNRSLQLSPTGRPAYRGPQVSITDRNDLVPARVFLSRPLRHFCQENKAINQKRKRWREGEGEEGAGPSNGGVVRGGGGAADAPAGVGGDGGGRAAVRRADLGGGHDRPLHRVGMAAALDRADLPRLPQPPAAPLRASRSRRAPPMARLHRALRLLRRAAAALLRLSPPWEVPAQGSLERRHGRLRGCRLLRPRQVRAY